MTSDDMKEALRGRLRCIHASAGGTAYDYCDSAANVRGPDAGYMASGRNGVCRLMSEVARGSTCSSCDYACNRWYRKLRECQDDGEVREVLREACRDWTPPPEATNRIPGEAEP